LVKMKKLDLFETTLKIEVLLEEIEYAKSCLQPHDTGHINTAISWLDSRVRDLKKTEHL